MVIANTDSFLPSTGLSSYTPPSPSKRSTIQTTTGSSISTSSSALYISDTANQFFNEHFSAITALGIGVIGSIGNAINRNSRINLAWEERVREAQVEKKRDDPNDTRNELDLRAEVAEMSPSMYGQEAMEMRRLRRDNGDDYDDDDLSEEEIQEFEEKYKIKYDPYYDQGYYEDELPTDIEFDIDNYSGDRSYKDGQYFFFNDGMYYRMGALPRATKLISWKRPKKR